MSKTDEPNLTPWFPSNVKPARPGVYLRDYPSGESWYARWDGKYWRTFWGSVQLAAQKRHGISGFQELPWRGLAEKPE